MVILGMPFSFTIFSPGTILFLIIGVMAVNLMKKLFSHRNIH